MGRNDNRLTPLIKQRRAQKKKKQKLKRILEENLAKVKAKKQTP